MKKTIMAITTMTKKMRVLFSIAIIALFASATPLSAAKKSETVRIVYPLDFPDVKRVHFMINTLNNVIKHYQATLEDYEINIVAYGPGLQYLMKDYQKTGFAKKPYIENGGPLGNGTDGRFAALLQQAGDSIKVYACGNTMQKKNVNANQLKSYVKVTPAGVIKVIDLQREGAALIKIR